jgi:hypothetical protein
VFQITNLNPGDAYAPKVPDTPVLSLQVGRGGDCGVFLGNCEAQTFRGAPAFRVLVNEKDLKRHWKKVGAFPLGEELQRFAVYGQAETGSPTRYKVTLEDLDARVQIDDAAYRKLERLSVWETAHILARVKEGTKWF